MMKTRRITVLSLLPKYCFYIVTLFSLGHYISTRQVDPNGVEVFPCVCLSSHGQCVSPLAFSRLRNVYIFPARVLCSTLL